MKSSIILFAILSIYHCQAAPNEETFATSCYTCSKEDAHCKDPFDEKLGAKVVCDQANSRTINKFRSAASNDSSSFPDGQRSSTGGKYNCVKLTKKEEGKALVERACYEIEEHVKDVCVYLKEEAEFDNCYVCNSDNCNGAASVTFASVLGIISFGALCFNRVI